ncbi:PCMT-domain-containing protein [Nemania sp. NC0429]|nr:PCMT-domain-containing protein [Nemania sp. NC0429]
MCKEIKQSLRGHSRLDYIPEVLEPKVRGRAHHLDNWALARADRGHYAPRNAYEDSLQILGYQSTISAPHMHAKAVELLLPYLLPHSEQHISSEEETIGIRGRTRGILDIGSGSGFLVHVFAELAGETSVVVGVEHIEDLRTFGEANMRKSAGGAALLASKRVRFCLGDGRQGWSELDTIGGSLPDDDGCDVIHVGAAAVRLHDELVRQLRSLGRLFIPVAEIEGDWFSDKWYIWAVDKGNICKAQYVSLIDAP